MRFVISDTNINYTTIVVKRVKYIEARNQGFVLFRGTLLYHKIYMYVPSKFTIKKDYFFHENKVKCN